MFAMFITVIKEGNWTWKEDFGWTSVLGLVVYCACLIAMYLLPAILVVLIILVGAFIAIGLATIVNKIRD